MVKRLSTFTELPVDQIVVSAGRLRPLSEAKVAALVELIGNGVFLGAITVRRSGQVNTLIDGAHRLEAVRRLGQTTIRVDVIECSASEALQMETAGNLAAGMTPLQDAIFLGVYQQEYERQHPETRRGVAGALAKHGLQGANLSFAEVVAENRQITPKQVRRIVAAGRALDVSERNALMAAPHRIALSEVEKLGKIGDAEERSWVVRKLALGAAKSVSEARRQIAAEAGGEKDEAPTKDPVEDGFNALVKAWQRAPMAAKKRFLLEYRSEVWEAQNKGAPLHKWAEAAE